MITGLDSPLQQPLNALLCVEISVSGIIIDV